MNTVLHTLRDWEPGYNRWCGPGAVGIITGKPTRGIAGHFARSMGIAYHRVTSTDLGDMPGVLRRYGYGSRRLTFEAPYSELVTIGELAKDMRRVKVLRKFTERVALVRVRLRHNRNRYHFVVWDRKAKMIADTRSGGPVPQELHRAWDKKVTHILFIWEATQVTTTVHNLRGTGHVLPPDGVYIGRPSIWGNPFHIGLAPGEDRKSAIMKYEAWIKTQPQLLVRLMELRGKKLYCWCAPRACHGDVLARMADEST